MGRYFSSYLFAESIVVAVTGEDDNLTSATLERAILEGKGKISGWFRDKECEDCNGLGETPGRPCPMCAGTKYIGV